MKRVISLILILTCLAIADTKSIDKNISDAWKYYEEGRYIKMERISRKIVDESLRINYPKGIMEGYYYLGIAYYSMGNMEKALKFANLSNKYSEKYNNYRWKAYSYTLTGEILRHLKRYREALESFKKALDVITKNKNEKMLSVAYTNLGNVYFDLGRFEDAVLYYKKSLKLAEKSKTRVYYTALGNYNLGITYYRMKKFEKAVSYLKKAYRVYRKIGNKRSVVSSAYYIAKTYTKLGRKKEAADTLTENIKYAKEVGAEKKYKNLLKKTGGLNGSF